MASIHQQLRFALWTLTLTLTVLCALIARAAEQPSDVQPLQGQVVEVSGSYAKVNLARADLQTGDAAELLANDDSAVPRATGTVTSVQDDYVVVKFNKAKPQQGQTIRFSRLGAGQGRVADGDSTEDDRRERKTPRELLEQRRAQREAERQQKQDEVRQKWLARIEARGIEAWQPTTDTEHAAALEKYQRMGEEVQKLLPGMQLYETRYFLFYSNIPPAQVAPYIRYLDAMYVMMARLFGIGEEQDVWVGRKAPVFAFLAQEQFLAFEQRYFQVQPVGAYGICHQSPKTGEVVIACYRGDDPHDFGQMLVHETSHGFVFRYKTKANLPVWVDEGMAEYIGEKMVPASQAVRNKEQAAMQQLKQTRRIGANFFETEAQLAGWQYGVASSMNKFLITLGQQRYITFIEGMKEGLSWQDALRQAYNATPEQFVLLYSRAVGVPGLGL